MSYFTLIIRIVYTMYGMNIYMHAIHIAALRFSDVYIVHCIDMEFHLCVHNSYIICFGVYTVKCLFSLFVYYVVQVVYI